MTKQIYETVNDLKTGPQVPKTPKDLAKYFVNSLHRGIEFERKVDKILNQMGLKFLKVSPTHGPDFLVHTKDCKTIAIEVKAKKFPINPPDIFRVVDYLKATGASKGIIVATSSPTSRAKNIAKNKGISIIRTDLGLGKKFQEEFKLALE